MAEQYYTTQLSAGLGLREETKGLFELWQLGMNTQQLCELALESGSFPNVTARRLRNIVAECFFPRYLRNEGVAEQVKALLPALTNDEMTQVLYLYTARANFILAEFVKNVYWQKYAAGYSSILTEESKSFVELGLQEGKMKKHWSETTIKRVSSYVLGCLVDYGFLEVTNRTERKLTPPRLSDNIAVYLAYELHFQGLGDNAIINHPDWQLFGLDPSDVREELKALAVNRHWIFQAAGSVFPDPERSGDNYIDICIQAKPDQATEIRELFAQNNNPSFDVINAIGGGVSWPTLQAALGAEGATNLLFKFMVADSTAQERLAGESSWVTEIQSLLSRSLGLTLRTKQTSWSAISDELWRFVLFSEFVFDLKESIPASLDDVPVAKSTAQPVIEELGNSLRKHTDYQSLYIERATAIEQELNLGVLCANITKLGTRDTFPFEEKCYLKQAVETLLADDGDKTRQIVIEHANSVWSANSDSQVNWELVKSSQRLIEVCADLERDLPAFSKNQTDLIEFYQSSLRRADQLHREFEQAVNDCPEAEDLMPGVVDLVRKQYRKLVEAAQLKFTHFVGGAGWPPQGFLSNTQVFDTKVAPLLKSSGNRVAYLMVDALRFELGYELNKQLMEDADAQLSAAFATLPSITPVGMASLLPGAYEKLSVHLDDGKTKPLFDGKPVADVTSRMAVFNAQYGDRFQEMPLKDFVKMAKKKTIDSNVDLLVLRSTEIDSYFENHPEDAPAMMQRELKQIRQAVNKLQTQGFQKVFIVTDHGFYMNNAQEVGDVVNKPDSTWKVEHQRMLLGNGNLDTHHYNLPMEQTGIKTDIAQFAGPRSLAPYRKGMLYYHGGLSIQECLVPVIEITLKNNPMKSTQSASVVLNYKNGATRITARFAVIELKLESLSADLFGDSEALDETEILLEAHSGKKVVGEARPGEHVNAATGTVTLEPNKTIKVTLKMDPEFEGKFKVKAIDPVTNSILGTALDLETDYAV